MRLVRIIFTCPWKYSAPVLTPACIIAISCPVISASNTSTSSSLLLFWDNSFHRSVPPSTYCAHFSQWGLDMKRIKEYGGANKTRYFCYLPSRSTSSNLKVSNNISETSVIRTLFLCCPYYEHPHCTASQKYLPGRGTSSHLFTVMCVLISLIHHLLVHFKNGTENFNEKADICILYLLTRPYGEQSGSNKPGQ